MEANLRAARGIPRTSSIKLHRIHEYMLSVSFCSLEAPPKRIFFSVHFSKLQLLCTFVFCHLVSSQALTAWHTSVGSQVVYQNATSGDIYHSLDTGSGSGVAVSLLGQKFRPMNIDEGTVFGGIFMEDSASEAVRVH